MIQAIRVEGVVLDVIPFRDHDRIFTIFTPDLGLAKIIVYRAKSLLEPLVRAEFILSSDGDLQKCKELTVLNRYLMIREQLPYLEAACTLLRTVKETQSLHQPAPVLYQLLVSLLEKLPTARFPRTIAASFQLKVLIHEGLLALPLGNTPEFFTPEEIALLNSLATSRSFTQLASQEISSSFVEKVQRLFQKSLD